MRLLILGLFLAGSALAGAPLLRAQGAGPVLLEPHDFSPDGAWRRRAARVRALRATLLEQRNLGALNAVRAPVSFRGAPPSQPAAATAVTGGFFVPVVAIAYADRPLGNGSFTLADYQSTLFGASPPPGLPYSLKTYYEELSGGRISLDGKVMGPVQMPEDAAFYTDGCKGLTITGFTSCTSTPNHMGQMLVAVLDSISTGPAGDTVWNRYDNDGPDGLPNSGDDDGFVDFIVFLQPEVGGECISTGATGIWSHRWVMSVWNGTPYLTRTPMRDAGGQPVPNRFLRINDYTIQSQLGGPFTACDGTGIMPVGTVAHETGHAFGLPDLYDTGGSTQGVGEWSLMGSGNYSRPYSPASYDAWSLNELGWVTVDTLGASRRLTTRARVQSDTVFYAESGNPQVFALLENRQALRSDSAHMNPDLPSNSCPPSAGSGQVGCKKLPGLLVWLINRQKVLIGRGSNSVNNGLPHGVGLLQADGLNQLRTAGSRNRGDRGDSYPGLTGSTRLSLRTNPAAQDDFGQYFGFIVDSIEQLPAGVMRFRFTRREPTVVRPSRTGPLVRVNGETTEAFVDAVPAGDQLAVGTDQSQLVDGGRTRFQFLSWSDGGAADHVITSSAAGPDTLVAGFAAEHRVRVTTTGGGTVAATVAGDLGLGVFVNEGVSVTLTATVPAGFVFAGWRGDTVSIATSLTLPMERRYDLEARFVGAVAVTSADAVSELLGSPRLSPAQKGFLDQTGNLNGFYDVGDLLALLRRSGQAVPPAVAALLARKAPAPGREVPR